MKTGGWAVGAALLLSSAPLIAADEDAPVVLEPTSPWNVHYADDYCRLARVFGAGASRVTLVIDKFGPGDGFNLTLAGPRMKFRQSNGVAKIRFGTEFPEQQLSFHSGSLGEGGPAWVFAPGVDIRPLPIATAPAGSIRTVGDVIAATAPPTDAEKASVTTVDIGSPLSHPVRLQTGSMELAFAAMDRCLDELMAHWGIDVARHKTMSRPTIPQGHPGLWVTFLDYPEDMLRNNMAGIVHLRLTIDEKGRPTACHVQQSTDRGGFNKRVCAMLMRRARFKPALDRDGKPMVSYFRSSVRFETY